jgi:hypothetical protein
MSLTGFIDMLGKPRDFRDTAITDKIVNITVDTCYTHDTGKWETGIEKNGDNWVIVEMYEGEEEAKKGHKKWVSEVTKNPNLELKSCITSEEWAFGDY